MKPIIIISQGEMTPADIKELRDNGLCVVEAKNPATVKFLDPIPAAATRTHVEDAAIKLSRKVLSQGFWRNDSTQQNVAAAFVEILVKGTKLDPELGRDEVIYKQEWEEEIRRMAREGARAERAAKKAAQEAEKKKAAKP